MRRFLIVLALLCTITSQQIILNSNITNTQIINPPLTQIAVEPGQTNSCPNPFGTNAQWLWRSSPAFISSLTFQTQFTLQHRGPIVLKMGAQSSYSAYFNQLSAQTLTGGYTCNTFGQSINPALFKCGLNTFTIKVTKLPWGRGALAFSISQDQISTYTTCPPGKFYDPSTCSCR